MALAGGIRYSIPTGRKDGLLADPSLVILPAPSLSVQGALQFFTARGLTLEDMVTLLGGHTVGFAHCSVFQERLSSVQGRVDPTMDPELDAKLVQICESNRPSLSDPRVFLDQNSSLSFLSFHVSLSFHQFLFFSSFLSCSLFAHFYLILTNLIWRQRFKGNLLPIMYK